MGLKIICGDHAFCWLNRAADKRKEASRRLNFTTKEQSNQAGKKFIASRFRQKCSRRREEALTEFTIK
jgi:hypothetical protein